MFDTLGITIKPSKLWQLTAAAFEAQLNTKFAVDLDYLGLASNGRARPQNDVYPTGAKFELELIAVTKRTAHSSHLRPEPFTLLFLGDHEVPLFSDVHVLEHDSLGQLVLCISAVDVSAATLPEGFADGRFYECIFN